MLRPWLLCVWLMALCVTADITAADPRPPAKGAVHTVVIENMQYNPPELRVHRGERIVWVNKDLFPHTVTAASHAFDSGSIAAGAS
jgi:plastocyanin